MPFNAVAWAPHLEPLHGPWAANRCSWRLTLAPGVCAGPTLRAEALYAKPLLPLAPGTTAHDSG